jgi:hypothetical protein
MRSVLISLSILGLVAACDKFAEAPATSSVSTTAAAPAEPPKQLTLEEKLAASPEIVRTFQLGELKPITGSKFEEATDGYVLTTAKNPGSYGIMIYTGPIQDGPALAFRVRLQVRTGKIYLITTYEGEPSNYERFTKVIEAGQDESVILPLDPHDKTILIIANANGDGASSGLLKSIELVGAPRAASAVPLSVPPPAVPTNPTSAPLSPGAVAP